MAEDRLDHLAGELAALNLQHVGAVLVGAKPRPDRAGELAKAARDDGDGGASRPHCLDKRAGAGIQGVTISQYVGNDAFGQSREQLDPLAQSRLECDLSPHRALGDLSDLRARTGVSRELVDAFLADQR